MITEKDKLVDRLKGLAGTWVIVEGKKDTRALRKVGLTKIIELNCPTYELAESLQKMKIRKVAILTDLDKEGKKLYGRIKEDITRVGINIDDSFRDFLFKETTLAQIEGLTSYLEHRAMSSYVRFLNEAKKLSSKKLCKKLANPQ